VVSKQDPGVPNWLDTQGYNRGMMFLRYQGLPDKLNGAAQPHAQRIKLSELRDYFSPNTPTVDPAARRAQIRRRQVHLKKRYGY